MNNFYFFKFFYFFTGLYIKLLMHISPLFLSYIFPPIEIFQPFSALNTWFFSILYVFGQFGKNMNTIYNLGENMHPIPPPFFHPLQSYFPQHDIWQYFGIVLENMQFLFFVEKYLIIGIMFRISIRVMKRYRKSNPTLSIGLQTFFQMSNRKSAIWVYVEKYFNITIFLQTFTRVDETKLKIQSDLSPLSTDVFSNV